MAGYTPDLRVSDAEHLPFADNTFDIVYSYGVMHHSPDTAAMYPRGPARSEARGARFAS